MTGRRRTLQDIATVNGFSPDCLAHIVDVDKSTIFRYWSNREWLDEIGADTLRKLMAVVPEIDEEVGASVLDDRRRKVTTRLSKAGGELNEAEVDAALASPAIQPHFLFTAIEAASYILSDRPNEAVHSLRALWGRPQTRALDVVFGTHTTFSVLQNPVDLIEASKTTLEHLVAKNGYSFARAVAQSSLAHHIGKSVGKLVTELPTASVRKKGLRVQQKEGFFLRGSYMGVLRQEDNLDVAQEYHALVQRDPIARLVEAWAFPSWVGDIESRDEFTLPLKPPSIIKTADEIVQEIKGYNEAYVWYLVTTFIPHALAELDPQFGGKLTEVQRALDAKAEHASLSELRDACVKLSKAIADHVP